MDPMHALDVAVIAQAQGILMARHRIDAEAAALWLQLEAAELGLTVSDIAAGTVLEVELRTSSA